MYRTSTVRSRSYSPPARSRSRPQSRRPQQQNSYSRSPSPSAPPQRQPQSPRAPPHSTRSRTNNRGRRSRAYPPDQHDESRPRKREVTLLLCVLHSTSHKWSTCPVTFKPDRINDRELWQDIRYAFLSDLQKPWRRFFGFKRVKVIVPIAYSPFMVPVRTNPESFPGSRDLVHAFRHPEHVAPDHKWVDYFCSFDASDKRQNGLEFIEGLWADKLAFVAVALSIAIIVVSIVWCALGGDLQTVFTVMGFVLTFVAAEIALIALYYQVISTDVGSSSGT